MNRIVGVWHWPPQSPDLNPVEHLWPMVVRKLVDRQFASKEALWDAVKEAFGSIRPDQVVRLYQSMPDRMAAVIKAGGRQIRY